VKKIGILGNPVNYSYLALGSNLGNRKINIEKAKELLINNKINIIKSSSYYLSKSWPNQNFPEFLNIVLKVELSMDVKNLFRIIKFIEKTLGRKNTKRNYPRVCDIDIIDFNGKVIDLKKNIYLKIPHSRMEFRNFVLIPLYEINKKWIHPKLKKNIVNLIAKLKDSDIRAIKQI